VLFIQSEDFLDSLQIRDSCQVHVEKHALMIFCEFPELKELRRSNGEGLTEKDHINRQFQLNSLVLPILKVNIGLHMDLRANINLDFKLIIWIDNERLTILISNRDELKLFTEFNPIQFLSLTLIT